MSDEMMVTAKEARVMLLIDSTFKYDDMEKARKLNRHIKERRVCESFLAKNFANKFDNYCKTGMIGAACPICNAFAEGKGRLLCEDCIEELEEIANIPQEAPRPKPRQVQQPKKEDNYTAINFDTTRDFNGLIEIEPEQDAVIEEETEKEDVIIIQRRKFYHYIAAGVAIALMINCLVAFATVKITDKNNEETIATVEDPEIPVGHE